MLNIQQHLIIEQYIYYFKIMTIEEKKAYQKAYYQAHKQELNKNMKAWRKAHKEYCKVYYQVHKNDSKTYFQEHKQKYNELIKAYYKSDLNALGETKNNIRAKSRYYLRKYGKKLPNYQIHHCFTYNDSTKFIYCSKEMHLKIHQFLRDNNIDADSDHYEQIKHLLDDTVIIYGVNNV